MGSDGYAKTCHQEVGVSVGFLFIGLSMGLKVQQRQSGRQGHWESQGGALSEQ